MAIIRGVHILAHGQKGLARQIALDVQQNQRLKVGTATVYGAGAYVWHPDRMPKNLRDWPQVVIEIDDGLIKDVCDSKTGESHGFFIIPGPIGSYVNVRVIEFVNI